MEGRDDKFLAVLERIAVANEKLIELAVEERSVENSPGPPFCPSCMTVNPDIRNEGGGGPMADFILAARCGTCKAMIFAVPEGWKVFPTADEAKYAVMGGGNDKHN